MAKITQNPVKGIYKKTDFSPPENRSYLLYNDLEAITCYQKFLTSNNDFAITWSGLINLINMLAIIWLAVKIAK